MKYVYRTAVAVLAGTAVAVASATPAIANYNPDSCPSGYSCYYDGPDLTSRIWTAPSCGWFDLGHFSPPLNDRVSSVYNRGTAPVWLYNWTGSHWEQVGLFVPGGKSEAFLGAAENIIDAVSITC